MSLPIRWAVVTELTTGRKCIMAKLVHDGRLYETAHIPPALATPTTWWLLIAAMTGEFMQAAGAQK